MTANVQNDINLLLSAPLCEIICLCPNLQDLPLIGDTPINVRNDVNIQSAKREHTNKRVCVVPNSSRLVRDGSKLPASLDAQAHNDYKL